MYRLQHGLPRQSFDKPGKLDLVDPGTRFRSETAVSVLRVFSCNAGCTRSFAQQTDVLHLYTSSVYFEETKKKLDFRLSWQFGLKQVERAYSVQAYQGMVCPTVQRAKGVF